MRTTYFGLETLEEKYPGPFAANTQMLTNPNCSFWTNLANTELGLVGSTATDKIGERTLAQAISILRDNPQLLVEVLREGKVWSTMLGYIVETTPLNDKIIDASLKSGSTQVLKALLRRWNELSPVSRARLESEVVYHTDPHLRTLLASRSDDAMVLVTLSKCPEKSVQQTASSRAEQKGIAVPATDSSKKARSMSFDEDSEKAVQQAIREPAWGVAEDEKWQNSAIGERMLASWENAPNDSMAQKQLMSLIERAQEHIKVCMEKEGWVQRTDDYVLNRAVMVLKKGGGVEDIINHLSYEFGWDWAASGNIGKTDSQSGWLLYEAGKVYGQGQWDRPFYQDNNYEKEWQDMSFKYGAILQSWFMALNDEAVQRLAREGIFEIPVTRTVGLEPEVLQKAGISQETQKVSTGNPVPDAALSSYSLGVHTDSWGGRGSLRVIQRVMVPTGKIVGMAGAGIGVPTENGEWAREAEVLLPSAQTFGVPVSTLVVNDNEEAKRLLREDTTRRSINVGRRSTQTREMSYF